MIDIFLPPDLEPLNRAPGSQGNTARRIAIRRLSIDGEEKNKGDFRHRNYSRQHTQPNSYYVNMKPHTKGFTASAAFICVSGEDWAVAALKGNL